ncbi:MAG: asparagine synthase B [Solirubrobacterales bacterium]|nr:asparagine synthase B [Solirubrobacterales bacterium]
MCGIAAIYGKADSEVGGRMLERLVHRGPDDVGSVAVGGAWLGHRRLSIVDVSGGHQPLVGADDSCYLVGNGEVYNHAAIRRDLQGHHFRTKSDNEVALALIERGGPMALSELNGMFAFAFASEDGRFLAARDPVGIKPLYWASSGDAVMFASEMAAFDPPVRGDIEVFPPGHYWMPERGLVRFAPAVPEDVQSNRGGDSGSRDRALTATREVLVDAVERQMMGDVPVGVFLSGGLDSTLVAAIAQNYLRGRGMTLKTFAVGLGGAPDLLAARSAAEYLGTEHHERVYTSQEATSSLRDVVCSIEAFDPSLVRSAVPNNMLAQFTAEHVKVVLTGEGADELFAGYQYMGDYDDPDELHAELVRSVEGLHNLNLQRCDRVTMAHGLEARVPFLDRAVIEHGLSLPAEWKLFGPEVPEKRLLREAFDGWLPEELLWRDKTQFGDGSGAASVLTDPLTDSISMRDFEQERCAIDPPLRTREELAYFRIFREHLGYDVRPERTLGRFATA